MRAYQIQTIQTISNTGSEHTQNENLPLAMVELPRPVPDANQVLIRVSHCGICHTELDEIEGRAKPSHLPIIPGHQAVGKVIQVGASVSSDWIGKRVGVAWISGSCQQCDFCRQGLENLCSEYTATGKDVDGGYAEYMVADAEYIVEIPKVLSSEHAAPLLCAGAIGYRSLSLCQITNGQALGLTGFGSSGKIALQLCKLMYPDSAIYVFARSPEERQIALEQGATWAGSSEEIPSSMLSAVIDTTPVWTPIIKALECLEPSGRVIVNAISKLDVDQNALLDLDFNTHLWREKSIKSVANVTREDVSNCLRLITGGDWRPAIEVIPFEQANKALVDLKFQPVVASKVLKICEP